MYASSPCKLPHKKQQNAADKRDVQARDHKYVKCSALAKQIGGILIEKVFVTKQARDHYPGGRWTEIFFELADDRGSLSIDPRDRQEDAFVGDLLDKERTFYRACGVDAL